MTVLAGEAPASALIDTLYRAHHSWLYGWLRGKLGCAHHAADLAHDTFVRLCAARETDALRQPRAYLGTIAHGLVVNHWRRLDTERSYLDALAALPVALAPSPEERALVLETLREVDAMLDRLPSKVRCAFLLSQLDGLTYAEIGRQLAVSERTVKKYMAQAMLHCLLLALPQAARSA